MATKTVLFDWDGTLVDSLSRWLDTCREVFKDFGIKIDDEEFFQKFFSGGNTIEILAGNDYQKLSRKLFERVDQWMEKIEIRSGVFQLLQKLNHMGVRVALVTNSYGKTVKRAVVYNKIDNLVSKVIGFEDVRKHKPDPEMIYLAMKDLQSNPDETMIVGDSDNDILSGKRAGIRTCFFYPKENEIFYRLTVDKISQMDLVIRDFEELYTHL